MISVVIPLYNKQHTIIETLTSVLEQSYKTLEVVIVDDGSTDKGVEVIMNYTTDERVRIIRQANQGVSVARNRGVMEATFEHVAFMDGDDRWEPTYLEHVTGMIKKYPDAGMYCTAGVIESGGIKHLRVSEEYKNKILEIDYFKAPFLYSHTSSTTVSKKYFNQTQGFPEGVTNFQDFYLFTAVALLSKVIYCGIPLSVYVGDVEGQATATVGFSTKLIYRARYLNVFTKRYQETKNKGLLVWLRSFSRNQTWGMLKVSNYDDIIGYFGTMEKSTQILCLGWGRWLYPKKSFRFLSLAIVAFQKIWFKIKVYPGLKRLIVKRK